MTTGDQEPTGRFQGSIQRQAELKELIAQKQRERQQGSVVGSELHMLTEAERKKMFADSPDISVDELLGKDSAQTCAEFFDLMKLKNFPGAEQITTLPKTVMNSRNGFLSWLRLNQKPEPASDLVVEGYPIGAILKPESMANRSVLSYEKIGAEFTGSPRHTSVFIYRGLPDMELTYELIDDNRSDFYRHADDEKIYLCTDGRIRNRNGGSISSNHRVIIGIPAPTGFSGEASSLDMSYIAELPIEDVLAKHFLENNTP